MQVNIVLIGSVFKGVLKMTWPKKVLRITYSIRITDKIGKEIIQIDKDSNYTLKDKLECVQGTVRVEYGRSWIYITVVANSDNKNYWQRIEDVINTHINN